MIEFDCHAGFQTSEYASVADQSRIAGIGTADAANPATGREENIPVNSRSHPARDEPRRYLESKRGKGGGISSKPMNKITIGEIVRLITATGADLVRERDGLSSVLLS